MGLKLYNETDIEDIADSIRSKTGKSDTMTVSEMSDEIDSISGEGVEIDTSLLLTSDVARTTGAVTLTSEIGADNYEGSTDVNLYGSLQNAPIKFYKQLGSTQSPSTDTLLNTSTTNTNGVASANVTITETSNLYSVFEGVTAKYPNANSNTVNVQYLDILFSDDCSTSATLTNYGTNISLRNGGTATITHENNYHVTTTTSGGESLIPIIALTGYTDDFTLEYDAYGYVNSGTTGTIGFLIYNDNTNFEALTDDIQSSYYDEHMINGSWTETNDGSSGYHQNKWLHYKYTIQNGNFKCEISENDTALFTKNFNLTLTRTNTTQYGLNCKWNSGSIVYFKNIIATQL